MYRCTRCGNEMYEGYVISDGDSYYCTDECLYRVYTKEEYEEMFDEEYAYWTTLED